MKGQRSLKKSTNFCFLNNLCENRQEDYLIQQLIQSEDHHQNEYYKTKQKVKREQDTKHMKIQSLIEQKKQFKEELDKDIKQKINKAKK